MFISGLLLSFNISNPYSIGYKIGFLTSLTVDVGNYIVIITMLTQNLLPRSRGILMVFMVTIDCASMMAISALIPSIQKNFGVNYIKGAEHIYRQFYFFVMGYWILILIFNVVRKCRKKEEKQPEENDDQIEMMNNEI